MKLEKCCLFLTEQRIAMLSGILTSDASMLASSGKVDMYVLQKLMTHKSPKMTQRYAHLRDESLKNGASEIDKIFNKQTQIK